MGAIVHCTLQNSGSVTDLTLPSAMSVVAFFYRIPATAGMGWLFGILKVFMQ
jgi:hypothetical protein